MSEYADDANPADLAEQATPLAADPAEAAEEALAEGEAPPSGPPRPHEEVDEADLLEQATPVTGDDDDYPNDLEVEPDV